MHFFNDLQNVDNPENAIALYLGNLLVLLVTIDGLVANRKTSIQKSEIRNNHAVFSSSCSYTIFFA